jgi:serine/threonine-protein kinase
VSDSAPPPDADRNLLFGVLALRADLITNAQFVEACATLAGRKDTPLADLLVGRGWLTPGDRADVQRLLERELQPHGGDAKAGLAATTLDAVREARAVVSEPDLAPSLGGPVAPPPALPGTGDRYTLSRLHATGGIGRVWLARDAAVGRDVALKDIRPERAANPALRARFLKEAQITGQLEHPGVVPIYGLGQRPGDGQPFYTMRFIRGQTLSQAVRAYHHRRQRGEAGPLDLRHLLTAFVGVCNAVGYAHARGVIHRDLKPRNVALGDYGEVMVLDWGLAKLVGLPEVDGATPPVGVTAEGGGEDDATADGQVLGTPAYMAPEQAAGRLDRIGPCTDVYGLGAVLYEILTGRPPFADTEKGSVRQQVLRDPPARPRELTPGTPPALEAACLKALAKEPAGRYAAARDLARDVERWLADEPVSAYRQPALARLARWGRRHRPLVAGAAGLLVTAVVALTAGTLLLGRKNQEVRRERNAALGARDEADAERHKASRAAARAEAVNRFLVHDLLAAATPERTRGRKVTVEEVLNEAARKIDTAFPEQPETEAAVRLTLAETYRHLGLYREAEPHARKARALNEALFGPEGVETLVALNNLADLLEKQGRFADAEPVVRQTLAVRRRTLGAEHPQTLATLNNLGVLLRRLGQFGRSEAVFRELLDLRRRLSGADDPETLKALNNLGLLLQDQGKFAEAEPLTRACLAARRRVLGGDHPDTLGALNNLALLLENRGQRAEAVTLYRDSLEAHRRVMKPEHPQTLTVLLNLAGLLNQTDRWPEAEPLFVECLAVRRKVLPANHPDTANSLVRYGDALARRGRAGEAEPLLREGLAMRGQAYPAGHPLTVYTEALLGTCLAEQGRFAEAEPLLVGSYEKLQAAPGFPPQRLPQMAERVVKLYEAWGKPDRAAAWRAKLPPAPTGPADR